MKRIVATSVLLIVSSACSTELKTGAALRAEAARADSSAAGYEVGSSTPSATRGTIEPTPGSQTAGTGRATTGQNASNPSTGGTAPLGGLQPGQRPVAIVIETAGARNPLP